MSHCDAGLHELSSDATPFATSTIIAARTAKGERALPAATSVVPAFAPHQFASKRVGATVGALVAVGAGDGPVGWGVGNVGCAQEQL